MEADRRNRLLHELRVARQFETLRQTLADARYQSIVDRPLSDWVVDHDRGLPLVFLSWPVSRILATPFPELYETPGVGTKKFNSLVSMLGRVAATPTRPSERQAFEDAARLRDPAAAVPAVEGESADSGAGELFIPEMKWDEWRAVVDNFGLEDLPLGRLAPALLRLPRALWKTPLAMYSSLSLGQIRKLKGHGTKRLQAIVEVFQTLHAVLGTLRPDGRLLVSLAAPLVGKAQLWAEMALARGALRPVADIQAGFVEPLVGQLTIDGGETLATLAARRLGLDGRSETVIQAARRLGCERSRIYMLLNDAAVILDTRWPLGGVVTQALLEWAQRSAADADGLAMLQEMGTVLFPKVSA